METSLVMRAENTNEVVPLAGTTNGFAPSGPAPAGVTRRPEVIDDFIRNFLVKGGLNKTLEAFEVRA